MVAGSDLRRLSVYADGLNVDLALPAAMPLAVLIPEIVDILATQAGPSTRDRMAVGYQLARPGGAALDSSTTLAQNVIHDGTTLVLSRSSTTLPAPYIDDVAEAVSTHLDATARAWTRRAARLTGAAATAWLAGVGGVLLVRIGFSANGSHRSGAAGIAAITGCVALLAAVMAHRVYRDAIAGSTLGLLATAFAAVAGLLAVPDGPGAPNLVLAATAAAVTAVVTKQSTGCGTVTLTTVSCLAIVLAGAALVAVITAAPLQAIGSMSAVTSVALLEVSPRVSIVWAGLAPRLPAGPDASTGWKDSDRLQTRTTQAANRLTSLVIACAASAAIGAISTGVHTTAGSHPSGLVFAMVIAVVLLLRARAHPEPRRKGTLLAAGTITVGTTFVIAAVTTPQYALWIAAATVVPATTALHLGFVAPAVTTSPVAGRSVELLEYLAFAAIVPLACWVCDFYGAVRGLHLL